MVELAGTGLAVAQVPLCRCGTRGCGNAGIQLRKQVPAGDLSALVALLRALPWTAVVVLFVRTDRVCSSGVTAVLSG
jgi:hypothetical protein